MYLLNPQRFVPQGIHSDKAATVQKINIHFLKFICWCPQYISYVSCLLVTLIDGNIC